MDGWGTGSPLKVNPDGSLSFSGTNSTSPLPIGKTDVDLMFAITVSSGTQTGLVVDSDASTNRAVKEIFVAANGFGEAAYAKFYRGGGAVVGEMYLMPKNAITKDSLLYLGSTLTCDINTGNTGSLVVYFDVKYYE